MDAIKIHNGEFKTICGKIIVENLLFKLSLILNAILQSKKLEKHAEFTVQKNVPLPK